MGEFLRMMIDLSIMSEHLPVGLFKHHFRNYDPTKSKHLRDAMAHFRMSELEASDYRSAYHQFCDWLYGWSVSDGTDELDKRIPREINITTAREKQEAERLLSTFQTLTSMSLRHLKVNYAIIEADLPRIGQGLESQDEFQNELLDTDIGTNSNQKEKIWVNNTIDKIEEDKPAEFETDFHKSEMKVSKIKTPSHSADALAEVPASSEKLFEKMASIAEGMEDDGFAAIGKDRLNQSFSFLGNSKDSLSKIEQNQELSIVVEQEKDIIDQSQMPESKLGKMKEANSADLLNNDEKTLSQDINCMYRKLDQTVEYSLLAMCGIAGILAFSELLGDKDMATKVSAWAHELSHDFVSNTLKAAWDLLQLEIPQSVTLATLRDPLEFKALMQEVIQKRATENLPKLPIKKLQQKLATLHDIFCFSDIHIFPNFALVHKEGVKCANYSAFDSNLWLTGGYDCIIKITDIRASNKHFCLAQYVGHKSIITDVHFTRGDSHIVSSSFDRTIKIWNAQTAMVERHLLGHADAITTCHVSADGRYIASGSLDNTIRFWDFSNGECISMIKKHTKWITKVRFSPDGRYLATASMDRRVYIWDVKILANSKSPSHNRCIDSLNDYVLDMIFMKPSWIIISSRDSMLTKFDYLTGNHLQSFNLAPSWACTLSLCETGEYFATGSFDNNINIFRTKDFVKVRQIRAFNLGIMCVRFPSDLSYIVLGTNEGFLQQIPL